MSPQSEAVENWTWEGLVMKRIVPGAVIAVLHDLLNFRTLLPFLGLELDQSMIQ